MYWDPRDVNFSEDKQAFRDLARQFPDEILEMMLIQMKAAQRMKPGFTYEGMVAPYAFGGLPSLSFVKREGEWYLYHAPQESSNTLDTQR